MSLRGLHQHHPVESFLDCQSVRRLIAKNAINNFHFFGHSIYVLNYLGLDMPLATELKEGGSNLSSGQRQLVCLARAVLRLASYHYHHDCQESYSENNQTINNCDLVVRGSKLLILDEATSSLDGDTDQHIGQLVLILHDFLHFNQN